MKDSQALIDCRESYILDRKKAREMKVSNHPSRPPIDSDRPIPAEARGGVRKHDHFYPFEQMKVGDSFWIASERGTKGCTAGAITKFAKKSGWKFTSRAQTEDGRSNKMVSGTRTGIRGTRIWRTA